MSLHSDVTQLTMEPVAKAAGFFHQDHTMFAPDQFPGLLNDGAPRTLAAVDGPAAGHPCHQHGAKKLDIERQVNHTWFGPKSFKDCRKMGNDVIFEFVVNHTSRMAPSGAVLEAYMTLTPPDLFMSLFAVQSFACNLPRPRRHGSSWSR